MTAGNQAQGQGDLKRSEKGGALFVALGILLSRISGFLRETLFAYAFGNSLAADAFKGALRIPNLLQNLLGEGVLSASFIPVYARLRASGKERESVELASAVFSILILVSGLVAALGIAFAPQLIDLITPGFEDERRTLAIELVRIFFPATAILVLSAWCLGVLNSHRQFFLPYVAPVLWNSAIIGALLMFRSELADPELARVTAWGVVVGSAMQFGVQLPSVHKLLKSIRFTFGGAKSGVKTVFRNFLPVALGRGVVQISAFIDSMIASLLAVGSVSALSYAQMIYLLPVSLFGMSVSAAELPLMSVASAVTDKAVRDEELRRRGRRAMRQIMFFIVPTTGLFLMFGSVIISALYQYGRFSSADTDFVSAILVALALGLAASTASRLYSSTFYAIGDPKTPFRSAILRVILSSSIGAFLALQLFPRMQWEYPAIGLALGSSIGAWFEFLYLRSRLQSLVGSFQVEARYLVELITIVGGSLVISAAIANVFALQRGIVAAAVICGSFGASYLVFGLLLKIEECQAVIRRVRRRRA